MRHRDFSIFARLAVVGIFVWMSATLVARPHLNDLTIRVVLEQNGDARITETRQMDIDGEGTECYIVVGNLSGGEVRDLQVTDETGTVYENIGEWDVDRSRSWKENRCGIVTKSNGYELCWGLGQSGSRTYTTTYTVTRLLKGYADADGFNYMFVTQGMSPSPDHVQLTIVPADTVTLTSENTRIWAFRYRGDVQLMAGEIVAETSEAFGSESAMIVMASFDKGLFAPADQREGSFEQLREKAFEGSDYNDEDSFFDRLMGILFFCLFLLVCFVPVFITLYKMYRIWRARRQIKRELTWWRDVPYGGDLLHANGIVNAYKYVNSNYQNLLSAMLVRFISNGTLKVDMIEGKKGTREAALAIGEMVESGGRADFSRLERTLFDIFSKAAGDDRILQPRELERYMKKNAEHLQGFVSLLRKKVSFSQAERERKTKGQNGAPSAVNQVFGLRKYLEDFTLANERHVQEVALWKEYLIYATLFGNANQVLKDMKAINPEYLKMDQLAEVMQQTTIIPVFTRSATNGTYHVQQFAAERAARAARAAGRGGSASWGGGGGFSGGGFGGGVR